MLGSCTLYTRFNFNFSCTTDKRYVHRWVGNGRPCLCEEFSPILTKGTWPASASYVNGYMYICVHSTNKNIHTHVYPGKTNTYSPLYARVGFHFFLRYTAIKSSVHDHGQHHRCLYSCMYCVTQAHGYIIHFLTNFPNPFLGV